MDELITQIKNADKNKNMKIYFGNFQKKIGSIYINDQQFFKIKNNMN